MSDINTAASGVRARSERLLGASFDLFLGHGGIATPPWRRRAARPTAAGHGAVPGWRRVGGYLQGLAPVVGTPAR